MIIVTSETISGKNLEMLGTVQGANVNQNFTWLGKHFFT